MLKFLKNKYLVIAIVLIAFLIIFFNQQIFNNKTLVPLDILQEFDLALKEEGSLSSNYLIGDLVDQFYPNYYFLQQNITNGEIPFWNPHVLTGIPFFADSQVGIFEFTHLLSYVFQVSPLNFPLFSGIIILLLLGLSFFSYLKNLKFDTLVSLFGTVALMFSGALIVWLNYALVWAFVWLPLILLCIDRICLTKDKRFFPLLSIVICFSLLAGYPQITLVHLIITGFYFLFRCKQSNNLKIKIFVTTFIFVFLGITLSAVQVGPAWDFIKKSESYEVGRGYIGQDNFSKIAKNEITNFNSNIKKGITNIGQYGVLAFSPKYYGSPLTRDNEIIDGDVHTNFSEVNIYSGLITIILAIISLIWLFKDRLILFWFSVGILSFSLAINLPFIKLLQYLPLVNKISLNRLRPFFVISVVLLAVYALQKLVNKIKSKKTNLDKILVLGLIAFCFFDLFIHFHNYNPGSEKDTSFIFKNEAINFLQENTEYERIIGLGAVNNGALAPILPNISTVTDLYDVRGYNPIVGNDFINFANIYLSRRGSSILADAIFDEQVIDLMSIKYAICPKNGCLMIDQKEKWNKQYENENISIYQNPNFLPRTYIAYDYLLEENKKTIKALESNEFDIYSQIIVNNLNNINLEKKPRKNIQAATITEYSPNQVIIQSKTEQAGILVLTDNYDDGWKVKVNNQEKEIIIVNGIFRGVVVPAGQNEISFSYLPKNFYLYLAISIFSLIFLIILSAIIIKRPRYY